MGKWKALPDPFFNAIIDTGTDAYYVCDVDSEESTLALCSDIAEAHNADIEALESALAERDATLAALLDVVKSDAWCKASYSSYDGQMERFENILFGEQQ